jgi:hypothetical protein
LIFFTDIDDCRIDSCLNNGTCVDLVHDYRCQCLPGFTGRMCQYDLRRCNETLCRNFGSCYLGLDGYAQCNCNQIYTGLFCETRKTKKRNFCFLIIRWLLFLSLQVFIRVFQIHVRMVVHVSHEEIRSPAYVEINLLEISVKSVLMFN